MKMLTMKAVTASLLVFTSLVSAFADIKYGVVNGSVEFLPEEQQIKEAVVSVRWKHNQDIAAEWYRVDDKEPIYYRIFEKSTTLSKQTGSLSISNLQKNFNGNYSVEVNSKESTKSVALVVLDPVSKPKITKHCNSTSCTLTCEAEQNEHAQYVWSDSRGNREKGPVWALEKPEEKNVAFTCNVSNPVSWKAEQVTVEQTSLAIAIAGAVAGIVIVIVIALVILCIWCNKRRKGSWDVREKNEGRTVSAQETLLKYGEDLQKANSIPDKQPSATKEEDQDIANGTCTVATIKTDGPSDGVHEPVTNGHTSHNPASTQQDDRLDITAESSVALSKTSQQDKEGEVTEREILKGEVENAETPTAKDAAAEISSSFLYQNVV